MWRNIGGRVSLGVMVGLTLLAAGCSDIGKTPSAPDPQSGPVIDALRPARTVEGDTVTIVGRGFGDQGDASLVLFSGAGGDLEAAVVSWSDTRVAVLVPQDAQTGPVRVSLGGGESNGLSFDPAPRAISFQDDIVPIFQQFGCISCHGGTSNLEVVPHAALMRGNSLNGPVIARRQSGESLLFEKLQPSPPVGEMMPPGGDVGSEVRLIIADWIDQGARDN